MAHCRAEEEMEMHTKAAQILQEVRKAVVGKDEILTKTLMVILSGGHILLEDIPGVGKTTLALAFSRAMQLECKRIQFTPDILPSDVTGFTIYNKASEKFVFQPGAAMCNLLLADEINRTSSKTQSALLEAMEEGRVTVDGVTHPLPKPFIVIATQNPVGSAGTQLLPESQLDRFTVRLSMGYPAQEDEMEILRRHTGDPLAAVQPAATAQELLQMRQEAAQVYCEDSILAYIVRLTAATRETPLLKLGASPRGSLAVASLARACAYLQGRDYVVPEDIRFVFSDALSHRVLLSPQAKLSSETAQGVLRNILQTLPAPGAGSTK
ncbi:MoxR family ATPase [Caproicibacterium argilliputei]|uniref:MoxR family ATPase n=2 Tax=Oscillospiraceae TaxID=216572 RepID=A0AA97H4M4_9FIRM|nr:MoxR family ATPase [Caproicibacterium argilliputei]WOC33663.1 MoxR family ATPase [Caproicibacterium argilliputei]